jgi:hypothetical protein
MLAGLPRLVSLQLRRPLDDQASAWVEVLPFVIGHPAVSYGSTFGMGGNSGPGQRLLRGVTPG